MDYLSIFGDTRQAVRFAFALDAYPIGCKGAAVRLALADARVTHKPELPAGAQADDLRAIAHRVLATVRASALQPEGALLTAAYTRDTRERASAIVILHPLFCILLQHLVDNRKLVRKLLDRHYTPIKERGQSWELYALADEFKCGHERTRRAAQALDECARKLECLALRTLQQALEPKPAAEVCHA